MLSYRVLTMSLGITLAVAAAAAAQGTSTSSQPQELPIGAQSASVGWNLQHVSEDTAPFGVTVDYANKRMRLTGDGDLVGEFNLSHFSGATEISLMGGFRAAERVAPNLKVFGQVLAGMLHGPGFTDFCVQPGGGVDVSINPKFDLRIRLDFPIDIFSGGHQTGTRIGVGVAVPIGRR